MREHDYYIYILSNRKRTVLYTGLTNSLERRIHQHRMGAQNGFTKRYNCNRLLYYEHFTEIESAIAREKEIKKWFRRRKDALIRSINPEFRDLAPELLGFDPL